MPGSMGRVIERTRFQAEHPTGEEDYSPVPPRPAAVLVPRRTTTNTRLSVPFAETSRTAGHRFTRTGGIYRGCSIDSSSKNGLGGAPYDDHPAAAIAWSAARGETSQRRQQQPRLAARPGTGAASGIVDRAHRLPSHVRSTSRRRQVAAGFASAARSSDDSRMR